MRVILVATLALLAGCAAPAMQSNPYTLKNGQIPSLSTPTKASVGSPIYTQFNYWSRTGLHLDDPITARVGLGRVLIPKGAVLNVTQIENEKAYCTEDRTYIDPLTGPYKISCLVDRNGDGRFDIVKAAPGFIWFESKLDTPAMFGSGEDVRQSADSKKMELIYQGYASKTVKLTYREFVNDMARPAFFQEASYEVSSFPAEVNFKNVRLKIIDAGNNGITYEVLTGF